MEKRKSNKIIGIDLGSYNSAVSVYEGGEVKVIANSEGEYTTPSYVSYSEDGIKVGSAAKRQATIKPSETIFNIKRLMGKSYDSVKDLKRPYEIVNQNGRAAVKINGKVYSPEEVSATILQKLKKTAEDYLGEEVERVVISVPAHFNADERESTKVAGEIAGFKVERIISEPTAAVLNTSDNINKKMVVYDFGGQTFDCSVVDVGDGVYEVISTNGDLDLGGSLIDEAFVNFIADEFNKEYSIDLRKDAMALSRLYESCEKAKIELSNSVETEINLPYITVKDGIPLHLIKKVNRTRFEQIAEPFINKTIEITKESISKSGLGLSEIDDILLVGGSSRIPLVQSTLEKMFDKKPSKQLNPDTCVSTGACIQGGVISGENKDILLLDVLSIRLGIETSGGIFTTMIDENSTIPCRKQEVFSTASDNQSMVQIHVLQGDRDLAKFNKSLGKFILDGIPPAPRGIPQIEVTFDVDSNGILSVSAKDKATGKENQIRIEGSTSLSEEEITRMKKEAAENAETDRKEKERIMSKNEAESVVFNSRKNRESFGEKLTEDDKTKLIELENNLESNLDSKTSEEIKSQIEQLNTLWSSISTNLYNQGAESDSTQSTEDVKYEEVK